MTPRMAVLSASLFLVGAARAQETMYLLAGNISPQLQTVDPVTGSVLTSVPVTGQEALFGGLAADAGGTFFSIDGFNDPNSDRLFKIDPNTGGGGVIGPIGANWNFRCVYVNPVDDVLYGMRDSSIFTMDKSTGLATLVANLTDSTQHLDQVTAFAIDANGIGYCTDIGGISLFKFDIGTGVTSWIADLRPGAPGQWYDDLAFNAGGALYGTNANSFSVYKIDTGVGSESLAFNANATGILFFGGTAPTCYPDCNGDGALNLSDFGCFTTKFALGEAYADCNGDGIRNLADFGCFTTKFALGCP